MVQLNLTAGSYLSSNDVTKGDQIVLKDEGEIVPSNFEDNKKVFQITCELVGKEKDGEFTWSMNKTTQKRIAKVHGKDTKEWVGKLVDVEILSQNVRGTVRDVLYGKPVAE